MLSLEQGLKENPRVSHGASAAIGRAGSIVRQTGAAGTGTAEAGVASGSLSGGAPAFAGRVDAEAGMAEPTMFYERAAQTSTNNPDGGTVVLGKYIPNDPASYEAVAQRTGSTYFSMGDWNAVVSEIGEDRMRNINRSFLDQQITKGKKFIFTADPATARVGTYTELEYKYLQASGFKVIRDSDGTFRATKK